MYLRASNYTTLHYTNYTAACYNYKCKYNYTTVHTQPDSTQITLHDTAATTTTATTLITLHATTVPLHYVQMHYTTLHPAVVGDVTTATMATTPPTFQSISGFALPSLIHNDKLLL